MTQSNKLDKTFMAFRWLIFFYLVWAASQEKPLLFGQSVDPFVVMLGLAGYTIVSTVLTLIMAGSQGRRLVLIALDVVAGVFLLLLHKASLSFSAPLLIGILQASVIGSRSSFSLAFLGMAILAGMSLFLFSSAPGPAPSPPQWIFFIVVALAVSTTGLFRDLMGQQTRQMNSLLSLIEAGQQLGSTLTFEKIFSLVTSMVKTLFNHNTLVIYLKEDKDEIMKVKSMDTPYSKSISDFDPKAAKSLLSDAVKEKKSRLTDDVHLVEEEEVIPRPQRNLRSCMCVPLVCEGEALGAILVGHQSVKHYSEEHLKTLSILGNQAAISIKNVQLHETTATLAVTDSVSGLYTHGYFQEHLEREFKRCKYANLPISVIIMDVDHFKIVNDTYGHPQGDALLKQLGGVIKSVTRTNDTVCRYGGDEFTITLPETNRIGAVLVAERVRQSVEEYEFVLGSRIVHISVSGGVASFPEDIETKKDLVEKADKALYEAKKQGRNKVCFSA